MLIPPEVDGTEEEGSPLVPPHGRRRFQLTPGPAGSRWYHSHAMAMDDLHKGAYTGQFGFVYVDGGNDPGHYDQELFLALRDWEPFFTGTMDDDDDDTHDGPLLEKPATMNTDPDGLEVSSMTYSINDKALGSGEPIRVREGQRLLIHFLNASAIENRRIALAGHKMRVIALDGNPVPTPQTLDSVFLGAGERIDAVVEMNQPGVWILGATEKDDPRVGTGRGGGVRRPASAAAVDRSAQDALGLHHLREQMRRPAPAPQQTIELIFEKIPGGAGKFNLWLVNGKPYPHEHEFVLQQGHALPAGDAQPHRRCASHAPAPALVGAESRSTESRRRGSSRTRSSCPTSAAPWWISPPISRGFRCSTATSSSIWTTGSRRCLSTVRSSQFVVHSCGFPPLRQKEGARMGHGNYEL